MVWIKVFVPGYFAAAERNRVSNLARPQRVQSSPGEPHPNRGREEEESDELISSLISCSLDAVRLARTTLKPAPASWSAKSRPMPAVAPVTTASPACQPPFQRAQLAED